MATAPGIPKKLLFSLTACLIGFALLEAVARVVELWRPPLEVDYGLGFDSRSRLYMVDPADPAYRVTRPSKHRFFLEERFLAEKPAGTLRIAALGGSSIRFLDSELQIMRRRLEAQLPQRNARVEIINAGGLAYGSHRLVPILDELLEYQPDAVLLYTGHNEFEEVEQLTLSQMGAARVEQRLARLAFFRLLRDGLTSVRVAVLESDHNARILSEAPPQARAWNHPFTREDIARRMAAYRRNLEIMIDLCRRAGVELVIGTVPSNLYRPVLPAGSGRGFLEVFELYRAGEYERGVALARQELREAIGRHQSSDSENEIIRELARQHGIALADIEARIVQHELHGVPGETLFRDHCHLNAKGNRIWRDTYEPLVLELLASGPLAAPRS